jgi:hypothetical protein
MSGDAAAPIASTDRSIVRNFMPVAHYSRRDHRMRSVQFRRDGNLGGSGACGAKLFGDLRFAWRRD